jgi:thymidine phosphorylase
MRDVLAVLRCATNAPTDLRQRALAIAAAVLELGGVAAPDGGATRATELLDSGVAYEKFERICIAQGGFREPAVSSLQQVMTSERAGRVTGIDNRKVARIAKFAGAPDDAGAGLVLHMRLGDEITPAQPLLTLYADTPSELAYAMDFAGSVDLGITIEG